MKMVVYIVKDIKAGDIIRFASVYPFVITEPQAAANYNSAVIQGKLP